MSYFSWSWFLSYSVFSGALAASHGYHHFPEDDLSGRSDTVRLCWGGEPSCHQSSSGQSQRCGLQEWCKYRAMRGLCEHVVSVIREIRLLKQLQCHNKDKKHYNFWAGQIPFIGCRILICCWCTVKSLPCTQNLNQIMLNKSRGHY